MVRQERSCALTRLRITAAQRYSAAIQCSSTIFGKGIPRVWLSPGETIVAEGMIYKRRSHSPGCSGIRLRGSLSIALRL